MDATTAVELDIRLKAGGVNLVPDQPLRYPIGADVGQNALNLLDLLCPVRSCSIDHMKQQIGLCGFVKRSAKGLDQLVRKVSHKTDSIRQDDFAIRAQHQLSGQGIKRGKELIGGVCAGTGQGIEQGGLAGIGIAHQRHLECRVPVAGLSPGLALAFAAVQPLPNLLDPVSEHAAVHLELCFARPATNADTTTLTLEVTPGTDQP